MLINYFHRYWRKFVRSGLSKVDTPHDRKSLLFINRMSVINVLLMIGFSITAPLFDLPDVLYFTLPFMAAFGLPPYFNKLGYLNFSRYYFAIIPVVFLAGVCIQNSAELGDKYLLLTSVAIPIILFKEKKSIYILFSLNIIAFFFHASGTGTKLTLALFLPDEPLAPVKLDAEVLGPYDAGGGMRLRFKNPSVDAVKRIHRYLSCIQD